jgi:pyruvate/2-oxoglutarate/acetoin dehydrogenase E1 component
MSLTRTLSYSLAINEALHQAMAADPTVLLIGQGVKSPWYVGNTAQGLLERFGPERVIDTPVSENAVTGAAVGAALAGMRPVVVHPRMDFMLYAFDPIVNEAANWSYMNGGAVPAPLVFWGIINRLGEQAAQHSQALHSIFAHVPGLKVVMPATPYDAKGLMIAAIQDPDPVVFIDDRLLYHTTAPVPEEPYSVTIGEATVARAGKDVTIAAISSMVPESLKAADRLFEERIDAEVIDLRSAKPLDRRAVLESVSKTGALVVADLSWKTCGLAAEVSATVGEEGFKYLRAPIARVTLPDCPAPASSSLEQAFYPGADAIVEAARGILRQD